MTYYIGLDFGTTNSILSYFEQDDVKTYKFGSVDSGYQYIPSFIAYDEEIGVEIGTAARTVASNNGVESYGNFKMQLPIPDSELKDQVARHPVDITIDYLKELLISENNPFSFKQQKGAIDGLVVSVPEIWVRDFRNLGRERLKKILTEQLELPLIQLISEPVAAASYYAWKAQKEEELSFYPEKILLVCDVGGGTFDVSICRISGNKTIEVLAFFGKGERGLEDAGVAFDRRCVKKAYQKKHQQEIDDNSPEFYRLLKEFESTKIAMHVSATKKITNYLNSPETEKDKPVYSFSDYEVNCQEIEEAFAPIKENIQGVMENVNNWLQENNRQLDRVFFVGGFSQFILVQRAITEALNIESQDQRIEQGNIETSAFAISYGACLIAQGEIDPIEKYHHTLGIVGTNAQTFDDEYITLITDQKPINDLLDPCYSEVSVAPINNQLRGVKLWIDFQSRGKIKEGSVSELIDFPDFSSGAKYQIGMRVDKSQISYLVIKNVQTQQKAEYELGNILERMFPTGLIV